jgi:hypothetical protein
MLLDELKQELLSKLEELRRKNNLRSLEVITWIEGRLKKMEEKPEPIKKEFTVEIPTEVVEEAVKEEKKATPKKKIVFKKK